MASDGSTCARSISTTSTDSSELESDDGFHLCDCDACFLGLDDEVQVTDGPVLSPQEKAKLAWKKIRNMVLFSSSLLRGKKKKWVQLAGHQGGFRPGPDGTIWKKQCPTELQCLKELQDDVLGKHAPKYFGEAEFDDEVFVQIQDLLYEFNDPCIMDCKMGVRTFLEEEISKARQSPDLRHDMYIKMTEVDRSAPTEEEKRSAAITKARYMMWRDNISSSSKLGFRIEGYKTQDRTQKNFKKVKTMENVKDVISKFTSGSAQATIQKNYLNSLMELKATMEKSQFFQTHEFVGSSLLFVHDDSGKADVWLIDFAKTTPLPPNTTITHHQKWREGNREDGYLIGVNSLKTAFQELVENNNTKDI